MDLEFPRPRCGRCARGSVAKICGRWRNGVPLALSPENDTPPGGIKLDQLNDFDYVNKDGSEDPQGVRCPIGAHTRRVNPRNTTFAKLVRAAETNWRALAEDITAGKLCGRSLPAPGRHRSLSETRTVIGFDCRSSQANAPRGSIGCATSMSRFRYCRRGRQLFLTRPSLPTAASRRIGLRAPQ